MGFWSRLREVCSSVKNKISSVCKTATREVIKACHSFQTTPKYRNYYAFSWLITFSIGLAIGSIFIMTIALLIVLSKAILGIVAMLIPMDSIKKEDNVNNDEQADTEALHLVATK